MTLRFENMHWLWIIALLVPMAIVALRMFRTVAPTRTWLAIVLRGLVLVCVGLLLAGATIIRTTDKLAVVAVVDVSDSVRKLGPAGGAGDVEARVRQYLQVASSGRARSDLLGVVLFDGAVVPLGVPSGPVARVGAGGAGVVGSSESVERPSAARGDVVAAEDALTRPFDPAMAGETDLAGAIEAAAMLIPPDAAGRIVLLSDGVPTRGDTLAAAAAVGGVRESGAGASQAGAAGGAGAASAGRGIPIDVVPIRWSLSQRVVVESLEAPSAAPAGSVVPLRVVVDSTVATTGRVSLVIEGEQVDLTPGAAGMDQAVTLRPGRNVLVLSAKLPAGRVHRMEARLALDDAAVVVQDSNLRAEAVTVTPGTGSVLLVRGEASGPVVGEAAGRGGRGNAADAPPGPLEQLLRQEAVNVESIVPQALPLDLVGLEKHDLVILENVPADAVQATQQEALVQFVTRLGGGLIMVGGRDSFGPGGWRGSQIEPILPVKLQLPERLVMPAAAVIIVMDSSGSMSFRVGGSTRSQQDVANEGAALAVRTLDRDDMIGVIEFNSSARTIVPLGPNQSPDSVVQSIRAIYPGGGTNMPPALELAYAQLKAARANVKHCIVLTDGVSQGRNRLEPMAKAMAADGIKLSTICVGDEADTETLEKMARLGGGSFYRVENPTTLPRVFLKAMKVVRSPEIREQPFVPVLTPGVFPATAGIEGDGPMPPLGGLVLTTPRQVETARTDAAPQRGVTEAVMTGGVSYPLLTPTGEPVLATWQAGLGRVGAFTSDASRWAGEWMNWPGYRRFWLQLARQTARDSSGRAGELMTRLEGDRLTVRYEAIDSSGTPIDALVVPATIFRPDGTRQQLQLAQVGPGTYEAAGEMSVPGTGVVVVSPRRIGGGESQAVVGGLPPRVVGVVRPRGAELRAAASDDRLLTELATRTGGRVLSIDDPAAAKLWDRAGIAPRQTRLPLWPFVAPVLAALVYLDLANRRIAWDRLVSRQFGAELLAEAAAATASRGQQAAATLSGLSRRSESRVETGPGSGAALSGNEAADLVAEARQRRVAARAAARMDGAPQGQAPEQSMQGQRAAQAPSAAKVQPEETGLAAAKRRARERME